MLVSRKSSTIHWKYWCCVGSASQLNYVAQAAGHTKNVISSISHGKSEWNAVNIKQNFQTGLSKFSKNLLFFYRIKWNFI